MSKGKRRKSSSTPAKKQVDLPPDANLKAGRVSLPDGKTVDYFEMFRGPLPPPEVFARYKEIDPRIIETVLKLTEKEQEHAHKMDERALSAQSVAFRRGQTYAFFLALATIALTGYLAVLGKYAAAVGFGGAGIAAFVTPFIRNRLFPSPPPEREHRAVVHRKEKGGE